MKKIIFIFSLLLAAFSAHGAAKYYFANAGNDSHAGTISAPFATPAKLSSLALRPGDSCFFKAGDTFTGTFTISNSGTALQPIVITSYGTGPAPVINGFETLTGWTNTGGNIWRCIDVNLPAPINMLLVNGAKQPLGRYPHSAYRSYSTVGAGSIKDASLPNSPSFRGAEVVIRKNHWTISRNLVSSQSGGVITYTTPLGGSITPSPGNGYFFQNNINCLSTNGDWCYSGDTVWMYNTVNPNSLSIKATRYNVQAALNGSYITVKGLNFTGANQFAIKSSARTGLDIENNLVSFVGINGLFLNTCPSSTIKNNTVSHCYNIGIVGETMVGCNFIGNTITDCGMIAGAGQNLDAGTGYSAYCALQITSNASHNNLVKYNVIDSAGYDGIFPAGDYLVVKRNYIRHCTMIADDGGAIYIDVGPTATTFHTRLIDSNIVMDCQGNIAGLAPGASSQGNGIYCDDNTCNLRVSNNVVSGAGLYGIFNHNNHNDTVNNNLSFNNAVAQISTVHDGVVPSAVTAGMVYYGNQLVAMGSSQFCWKLQSVSSSATGADIYNWGTSDNNYLANIYNNANVFQTQITLSDHLTPHDITWWRTSTHNDDHSGYSFVPAATITTYNASPASSPATLSYDYKDLTGTYYNRGTVTLGPYRGLFLIYQTNPAGRTIRGHRVMRIHH